MSATSSSIDLARRTKATHTRLEVHGTKKEYSVSPGDARQFLEVLRSKLSVRILSDSPDKVVFDLVGVAPALANALRRVMISEVPTMAIEQVYIRQNTGVMQDEVLAHRLGLLPIRADPARFHEVGEHPSDKDTLVFILDVKGASPQRTGDGEPADRKSTVYSSQVHFQPSTPDQEATCKGVGMVHGDIEITRLLPSQDIELEAHASKGIGREHAKWSPVATATYRMLPDVRLSRPIRGDLADRLVSMCAPGVFGRRRDDGTEVAGDIEDLGRAVGGGAGSGSGSGQAAMDADPAAAAGLGLEGQGGEQGVLEEGAPVGNVSGGREYSAYVKDVRKCTMCRECIRHPGWQHLVELRRKNEHFEFSVESAGQFPAAMIVKRALRVLARKCSTVVAALDKVEGLAAAAAAASGAGAGRAGDPAASSAAGSASGDGVGAGSAAMDGGDDEDEEEEGARKGSAASKGKGKSKGKSKKGSRRKSKG